MGNRVTWLLLITVVLFWANAPVVAAYDWFTMVETGGVVYQVDKQTIKFWGEDAERSLEMWIRIIDTRRPDVYSHVHYLVRQNDMTFMKKEHIMYSISGAVIITTDTSSKGWMPLSAESPVGIMAKHLFADYHEDEGNSEAPAASAITVNRQELKQALEDDRIKHKVQKDGTKLFSVQDAKIPGLFSGISHSLRTDYCLSIDASNYRSTTFRFKLEDTRPGVHSLRQSVTIQVDDKEWVLTLPLSFNSDGYRSVAFTIVFKMPDSLVNAMTATKNPVKIKWKHCYNGEWRDYERVIPDKALHDIQLMYLGIRSYQDAL
ncbi:MAG TPA: hypothetical protein PKA28_19120 [Methylomusa anaerophila]|uniref:Uncharacterized protein n=1 Tax=Methylomusa anaerophila TaxID=1930071 RepID=A0A348AI99_9FIRM|nr:hypothetical protein [Methylomusa anaerophila]BBB90797.1 hypothetical protein MAMMFC1_01458 [Methylomusa anaerophila]HML90546.1 hypothetical protein [Methylomusa anaerophila]